MRDADIVIGAFEAKTQLSQLLREIEKGRTFTIQRRGRSVARLVPADDPEDNRGELRAAFRQVRETVAGPVPVGELIERGRRY
jgi:prevent-host-death family protein